MQVGKWLISKEKLVVMMPHNGFLFLFCVCFFQWVFISFLLLK